MLYNPQDTNELLHIHLEQLASNDQVGVDLGFTALKGYLLPLMAGDLGFIIARPGNAKTSMMLHIARIASQLATHDPKGEYGPPIFISNEMPIEELHLRQLAYYSNIDSRQLRFGKEQNDWEHIHRSVDDMLIDYPITYIGSSLYEPSKNRRITVEAVRNAIEKSFSETGLRPRVVCVDYLQRMLTEQNFRDNRRLALNEVVETCKDIALDYKVPVVIGSQASREVDTEKFPIPDTRHGKETGSIEEAGDWVISGMRPSKYYKVGEPIPYSDKNIIVTPELYFVKVLKQRSGDAGRGAWVSFDPRIGMFGDIQFDDVDVVNDNT